jgi:SAM-dependent methyltransferase
VGAFLAAFGHDVVGVDIDPQLIAAAELDHPGPLWLVGDLAELDLAMAGVTGGFDVVVCAGNVIPFLADSTRREVLAGMGRQLRGDGRVIVGFGAGRGYEFPEFLEDAAAAGLAPQVVLESWDLRPFTEDSDFIVAVLGPRQS